MEYGDRARVQRLDSKTTRGEQEMIFKDPSNWLFVLVGTAFGTLFIVMAVT